MDPVHVVDVLSPRPTPEGKRDAPVSRAPRPEERKRSRVGAAAVRVAQRRSPAGSYPRDAARV